MLMQPVYVSSDGPAAGSGGTAGNIPWMCGIFICVFLGSFAIAIILSLIPLYLQRAGAGIVPDSSTETDDITRTFVSDTIIVTDQSMTVTNYDEIARQIEAAYGLPAGSIRVTNIVISGTTTNTGSSRRRRKLDRKKRELPSCDQFGSARSFVQITIRISYPRKCGVSSACKKKFANGILTRFNTNTASFPVTFVFADGRTTRLALSACMATSGPPFFGASSGTGGAASAGGGSVCSLQWISIGTTVAGVTNTPGTNANLLSSPRDVFLDTANTFVVADTGNHRIQRWVIDTSQGGTVAGQVGGTSGSGVNQLNGPEGVIIDANNNIYIADTANNRVLVWTLGTTQGSTVNGPALGSPTGIVYNANSNRIFVSNTNNNQVIQYTLTNPVVSTVVAGTNAAVPSNPLNAPTGIFFDASSNSLIIANRGANNIIQWFLATNTFLVLAGDPSGTSDTALNRLNAPRGVTLDSNGNIIVADTGNSRIMLFASGAPTDGTKNGRIIAGTGTAGTGNDQLNTPSAVRLDNQGSLYVADTTNHRIQRFKCIQT